MSHRPNDLGRPTVCRWQGWPVPLTTFFPPHPWRNTTRPNRRSRSFPWTMVSVPVFLVVSMQTVRDDKPRPPPTPTPTSRFMVLLFWQELAKVSQNVNYRTKYKCHRKSSPPNRHFTPLDFTGLRFLTPMGLSYTGVILHSGPNVSTSGTNTFYKERF